MSCSICDKSLLNDGVQSVNCATSCMKFNHKECLVLEINKNKDYCCIGCNSKINIIPYNSKYDKTKLCDLIHVYIYWILTIYVILNTMLLIILICIYLNKAFDDAKLCEKIYWKIINICKQTTFWTYDNNQQIWNYNYNLDQQCYNKYDIVSDQYKLNYPNVQHTCSYVRNYITHDIFVRYNTLMYDTQRNSFGILGIVFTSIILVVHIFIYIVVSVRLACKHKRDHCILYIYCLFHIVVDSIYIYLMRTNFFSWLNSEITASYVIYICIMGFSTLILMLIVLFLDHVFRCNITNLFTLINKYMCTHIKISKWSDCKIINYKLNDSYLITKDDKHTLQTMCIQIVVMNNLT